MKAWIRILDAPGCYECAARAERKSVLQGSGLVRTVGPCAQRKVPRAIATARDALSNDRRESAARFERPAKQVLALATEPRVKREARSALYRGMFRIQNYMDENDPLKKKDENGPQTNILIWKILNSSTVG